jgi:NAD-dependent dihydropyrimidine dehydrogenase PreA subunit
MIGSDSGEGTASVPSAAESQNLQVVVDTSRCIGCEACVSSCPTDVFRMTTDADQRPVSYPAYPSDCCDCFLCLLDCPTNCITINFKLAGHGFKSIYTRMGIPIPDPTATS